MIFFSRTPAPLYSDFSSVGVDMHSHLLPGLDDGAVTISDSVSLIIHLRDMGFVKLYTTPHSFDELYHNTPASLFQGRRALDHFIPEGIELDHSSEYYLDEEFSKNLERGHLVPLPGNRLLIEFSQVSRPLALENEILKIIAKGYVPVIAHPERYPFFVNRVDYLIYLKSLGAELQLNALSLTTYYGRQPHNLARSLIKNKLFDFIGTDLHHIGQIDELRKVPSSRYYLELIDAGTLKNKELEVI